LAEKLKISQEEQDKVLHPFQRTAITDLENAFLPYEKSTRTYLYVATGGGKTLITNEFIHESYLSKGKRIFWLSHEWFLLLQAAKGLIGRFGRYYNVWKDLAYYSSEGDKDNIQLKLYIDSYKEREWPGIPKIVYSTWQSFGRILQDGTDPDFIRLRKFAPSLIVIDEAHWGKGGEYEKLAYEKLFDKTWSGVPILGLSGTPKLRRREWRKKHCGNAPFATLVKAGYLARPIPIQVDLKGDVKIKFRSNNFISNYNEISIDKKRNRQIFEHYKENRHRYKKTLIFTCTKEHADQLYELFIGFNVVKIYSNVEGEEKPKKLLEKFAQKQGGHDIAIVVDMAKEGVDIPNLQTVFLAKPVTSQIAFSQMIGRGSRRTAEKSFFYIVDFHDSVADPKLTSLLYHFSDYYQGAADREETGPGVVSKSTGVYQRTYSDGRYYKHHDYVPNPDLETLYYGENTPIELQQLNGLRITPHQTFGIEFELSSKVHNFENRKSWDEVANGILEQLKTTFGADKVATRPLYEDDLGEIDHGHWNVAFDGSCGWEIVSPILKGRDGFEEIISFLSSWESDQVLGKIGVHVDYTTGTHVHLGYDYSDPSKFRKLLTYCRAIEPAMYSLIAPSRVQDSSGEANSYASSLRAGLSDRFIASLSNFEKISDEVDKVDYLRYLGVNLTAFGLDPSTVEVRYHSGTFEGLKILTWVSLWMNVLNAVEHLDISLGVSGNGEKKDSSAG